MARAWTRRFPFLSVLSATFFLLTACTPAPPLPTVPPPPPTPVPTVAPTRVPTQRANAKPTRVAVPTRDLAAEGFVPVVGTVDGDTIRVSLAGVTETVRVIGIAAPESSAGGPRQCYGREASVEATRQLSRQLVRLTSDPTQGDRDEEGRLLRYVERADGLDFGFWMILNGFAHEYGRGKPYERQADYKAGYADAEAHEMGFWSPDTCKGDTSKVIGGLVRPAVPRATAVPQPTRVQATSVEIASLTSPVSKGGNVTLVAKTTPGAQCLISALYQSQPRRASGMENKSAGADGQVTWTWTMWPDAAPGDWTVNVTCGAISKQAPLTVK